MTYDPRVPARNTCVLGYQIERWAQEKPDGNYSGIFREPFDLSTDFALHKIQK